MHRLEPAEADQLGDAASVVSVRLHAHGGKGCPHMAGFHYGNSEAFLDEASVEPL